MKQNISWGHIYYLHYFPTQVGIFIGGKYGKVCLYQHKARKAMRQTRFQT